MPQNTYVRPKNQNQINFNVKDHRLSPFLKQMHYSKLCFEITFYLFSEFQTFLFHILRQTDCLILTSTILMYQDKY